MDFTQGTPELPQTKNFHRSNRNTKISMANASDTVDYLNFGKKVYDQILDIESYRTLSVISIDLSPALNNDLGHVGIIVTPTLSSYVLLLFIIYLFI